MELFPSGHLYQKEPMYQMIRIPEPCSADWNSMSPEGKGKHCAQCCKTVIDFTQWESADILAYLKKHSGVCGHFRKAQLDVPIPTPEVFIQQVDRSFLSLAQKIAAVFLFVFGIMAASCNTAPADKMPHRQQFSALHANSPALSGDTIILDNPPQNTLQGEPVAMPEIVMPNDPVEVMGGAPVIEERPVIMPEIKDSLFKDSLQQ